MFSQKIAMKKSNKNQIESLVKSRDYEKAIRIIKKELSKSLEIDEINTNLGFLFKLGQYNLGYKFSMKIYNALKGENKNTIQIWLARFVNSLGGSKHSLKLLEKVTALTKEEHYIKTGIFLSNFQFKNAKKEFELGFDLKDSTLYSKYPMRVLTYTDALSGCHLNLEAIKYSKQLLDYPQTQIDLFCIKTALAEYYIKLQVYSEAQIFLSEASKNLPKKERRVDYGLYLKWKGILYLHQGELIKGRHLLLKAFVIFNSFPIREEVWITIVSYLYKSQIFSLNDFKRFYLFPGLSPELQKNWILEFPELKKDQGIKVGNNNLLIINFSSEEVFYNNHWHPGISQEILVIGSLAWADKAGLSFSKLFSLLWPSEVFSYPTFEERLFQIINRINKKYDFKIYSKRQKAFLPKALEKVTVINGSKFEPSFCKGKSSFTNKEFRIYYNVSKSMAQKTINSWLSDGKIKKKGTGPSAKYLL